MNKSRSELAHIMPNEEEEDEVSGRLADADKKDPLNLP